MIGKIRRDAALSYGNETISVNIDNDEVHIGTTSGKIYVESDVVRLTDEPFDDKSLIIKQDLDKVDAEINEKINQTNISVDKLWEVSDEIVDELIKIDDNIDKLGDQILETKDEITKIQDIVATEIEKNAEEHAELSKIVAETKHDVDVNLADIRNVTHIYNNIIYAYQNGLGEIHIPQLEKPNRISKEDYDEFKQYVMIDVDRGIVKSELVLSYNDIIKDIDKKLQQYDVFDTSPSKKKLLKMRDYYERAILTANLEADKIVNRKLSANVGYNRNDFLNSFTEC